MYERQYQIDIFVSMLLLYLILFKLNTIKCIKSEATLHTKSKYKFDFISFKNKIIHNRNVFFSN